MAERRIYIVCLSHRMCLKRFFFDGPSDGVATFRRALSQLRDEPVDAQLSQLRAALADAGFVPVAH